MINTHQKGDVWSLKPNEKKGILIPPLILLLKKTENNTWLAAPLFDDERKATHKDFLIHPYQEWLHNEDWFSLYSATEIPTDNFFKKMGSLPFDIFNNIENGMNDFDIPLPKGIMLIQGIGDEREKYHEKLKKDVDLAASISIGQVISLGLTIIRQKVHGALTAIDAEIYDELGGGELCLAPVRGRSGGSIKTVKAEVGRETICFSIKDKGHTVKLFDIFDDQFTEVDILNDDGRIPCMKIHDKWLPEKAVSFDRDVIILIVKNDQENHIRISYESQG